MAIRKGDWKLVKYSYEFAAEKPQQSSALISPPRLYNLSQDIREHSDLATAQPDKVNELHALWDQWNQTLVPPLWAQESSAPRE
jgi:arylsulfatase A-like enzyme